MEKTEKQEYLKEELTLNINAFNKPNTLKGVDAWAQLILDLCFTSPGTYPSMPEMGVDIEQYQFDFSDEACDDLKSNLSTQISTYLPDIPMEGLAVKTITVQGNQLLVIHMAFREQTGEVKGAAIAFNYTKGSRKFLDWDVSWNN